MEKNVNRLVILDTIYGWFLCSHCAIIMYRGENCVPDLFNQEKNPMVQLILILNGVIIMIIGKLDSICFLMEDFVFCVKKNILSRSPYY